MASLEFPDLTVEMSAKRSYRFTEEGLSEFAKLVGDFAPVHFDPEFAKKQGFAGRIVHGLYVQSVISGMLGSEIPGQKSVINSINMKMHGPVIVGQTVDYLVTISALTPAVSAVSLTFSGTVGEKLVISGKALCSFPA